MADGTTISSDQRQIPAKARPRLQIALVNNMPDSALQATERQFTSLIQEAAGGDFDIKLSLYTFANTPRGEIARAAMAERYGDIETLTRAGADALIVTSAPPSKPDLRSEPYWTEFEDLVDWARTSTASSLYSGLAAHAAVLHLDGVAAEPLPGKCSGVFTFERVRDEPLTDGLPGLMRIPHARRTALPMGELEAKGYRILTQSPRAGVDMFTRHGQSLFVFLEGHPEFEADSLLRDYCRDVGRFLRGEQAEYPQSPFGYFDAATERSFRALAIRARTSREAQLLSWCGEIADAMRPARPWRAHAVALFRNWLGLIAKAGGERPANRLSA
jgi:homoserine O-succinyltransferase